MDFNIFDLIVISITLILAIKGYFSGIIREMTGLLGIGLGLFLGSQYYKDAGIYINDSVLKIPNESAINLVGFVAIFVITWAIIVLIGMLFSKMLSIAKLGLLDRLGGVVFSAGKFFIIVSVIVTMLSQIEALQKIFDRYQQNSIMWPIMEKVGKTLVHLKKEDIEKQIKDVKEKVDAKMGKDIKNIIDENKDRVIENISEKVKPQIDEAVKKAVEKAKGE
jgi:membrane protein required for colicin V production